MARIKLTPLQRHSRKLYERLKKRTEEKKNKHGRIIRHGQPIPFTEPELYAWLYDRFGDDKSFNCRYCLILLKFDTCAYDHEIPLSRAGSPGLGNLLPICHEDNNYKGKLRPEEYIKLKRILLEDFGYEARADIEGRLKKATKLAASARWAIKKKAKTLNPKLDSGWK